MLLKCEDDFVHDLGLVLRHASALANAKDPQKVQEVGVLLLHEPAQEVLNVLLAHTIHDEGVVAEEVPEHPGGVDVVAHLRLEKRDVASNIERILLSSTIQILVREKKESKEEEEDSEKAGKKGRKGREAYICQDVVGKPTNLLETRIVLDLLHGNAFGIEAGHALKTGRGFEGNLKDFHQDLHGP